MALLFPKSQPHQHHSHQNESTLGRPLLVFPWFGKFRLQEIKTTGGLHNVYLFQETNQYSLKANNMAQWLKTLASNPWDLQPECYPRVHTAEGKLSTACARAQFLNIPEGASRLLVLFPTCLLLQKFTLDGPINTLNTGKGWGKIHGNSESMLQKAGPGWEALQCMLDKFPWLHWTTILLPTPRNRPMQKVQANLTNHKQVPLCPLKAQFHDWENGTRHLLAIFI